MESSVLQCNACKYLIVGSNGFIGNQLTHAIKKHAHRPQCIDYAYVSEDFAHANLAILKSNPEIEVVVFCGGVGGFGLCADSASRQGPQYEYFVHACSRLQSIKQFFLISSLGAAASRIASPYKRLCIYKENATASLMGRKGVTIRLPSIYGYDPIKGEDKGLPGAIVHGLVTNKTIRIYGKLSTSRNYISVEDAARSMTLIITRKHQGMAGENLINLASRYNLSIHQIISIICLSLKQIPRIQLVPTKQLDIESHDLTRVDGDVAYIYSDLYRWSRGIYDRT